MRQIDRRKAWPLLPPYLPLPLSGVSACWTETPEISVTNALDAVKSIDWKALRQRLQFNTSINAPERIGSDCESLKARSECPLLALSGPKRTLWNLSFWHTGMVDRYGTASFGPAAAILGALATLVGTGIALLGRRATRSIGFLIGAHASLAVTAYVLLLAYVLLPR